MRRAPEPAAAGAGRRAWLGRAFALGAGLGWSLVRAQGTAAPVTPAAPATPTAPASGRCAQPVYLSFDTGHMGVAPLIAEVLNRRGIAVTFFLANERTLEPGSCLDDRWAPWWRERAAEGHAFGSHTWDHEVWQADLPDGRMRLKPTAGPQAMTLRVCDGAGYRDALAQPARRFAEMTGRPMGAIFRAPAGRTSPQLLAHARAGGWTHVGWSPAGFLGDELPSERHPNDRLLATALRDIRAGDILVAHLGIWSRREPWAPAVLDPLVAGLQARGLCFATLRDHPVLGRAASTPAPVA